MPLNERRESYKIFDDGEHIGFLRVSYTMEGRKISADFIKPTGVFNLMIDENRHVAAEKMHLWIQGRIVPRTRMNIDKLLAEMGLSEYDELCILKYTDGRNTHDKISIDFSTRI